MERETKASPSPKVRDRFLGTREWTLRPGTAWSESTIVAPGMTLQLREDEDGNVEYTLKDNTLHWFWPNRLLPLTATDIIIASFRNPTTGDEVGFPAGTTVGAKIFNAPYPGLYAGDRLDPSIKLTSARLTTNWLINGADPVPGLEHLDADETAALCSEQDCHANVMPLPMGMAGALRRGIDTIPDVFFEKIRRDFLGIETPSLDFTPIDFFYEYYAYFGKGQDGWKNFVDTNYLLGSFVDDDYRVIPLFDRTSGAIIDENGTIEEPSCREQALQLAESLRRSWNARASAFAANLEDKLYGEALAYQLNKDFGLPKIADPSWSPPKSYENAYQPAGITVREFRTKRESEGDLSFLGVLFRDTVRAKDLLTCWIDSLGTEQAIGRMLEDPEAFESQAREREVAL